MDHFLETSLFEHRFWLQILGDHSRFIYYSLSPNERKLSKIAYQFIKVFDQLLYKANQETIGIEEMKILTKEALQTTEELQNFKLNILKNHLKGRVSINMAPTFLNHMLNELEEYLIILGYLINNKVPKIHHTVHYHQIWLLDAVGHAATISNLLDEVEKKFINVSDEFAKDFENFYLKALEMGGYLRTDLSHFPALSYFNHEVNEEMNQFQEFLNELKILRASKEVLGSLTPLMADHMDREECYFLLKVALSSKQAVPPCDPTKPRFEN